ncbi:MAG TPA: dUTP diphosphatase [Spirochaetia bacterium]|nr:dUTP diphosphatase [Spirochaetia bacterium]
MPDEPVVRILVEEGAAVPEYKSQGAAGADLRAFIPAPLELAPGARTAVPTGLRLELPEGFEAQVRPRSGLALEKGVTCLNSPGTIDADYRGEVKVILANLGREPVVVSPGDRIAQLVVAPVSRARFVPAEGLGGTERGSGGFGSTGL